MTPNDSRLTGTSLGMSEVTILEGPTIISEDAVLPLEEIARRILSQEANSNTDSSGRQLNGIVWRRRLALRAATTVHYPINAGDAPLASALVH